jgi:hypothetical protein
MTLNIIFQISNFYNISKNINSNSFHCRPDPSMGLKKDCKIEPNLANFDFGSGSAISG